MTPTTTKRRAILSDLAEQLAAAAAALERVNTLACELHGALAHDDVTDDDFDTAEEITDDLQGRVWFKFIDTTYVAVWQFTPADADDEAGDAYDFLTVRVYSPRDVDPRGPGVKADGSPDPAWAVASVALFTRDLDPSYLYGGIHARTELCCDLERSGASILEAIGKVLANLG